MGKENLLAAISLMFFLMINTAGAEPQKKPLSAIDIDQFTSELQVVLSDASSMTQVWWIPAEFWGSAFTRTNPALAEQAMAQLADYGILAIVQADITPFAKFVFHDRDSVAERLAVSFRSYSQAPVVIKPATELSDSVQMLLGVLAPMFANTMGELGKNMHLFVMNNKDKDGLIADPYQPGKILVELAKTKTTPERHVSIEFPVDALYEPRYCPNGKPAHISWKYCPWSGKKL